MTCVTLYIFNCVCVLKLLYNKKNCDLVFQIDELMKDFRLTDETYMDIMKLLNEEMNKGLSKNTHHMASVKMFPTYVRSLPNGAGE